LVECRDAIVARTLHDQEGSVLVHVVSGVGGQAGAAKWHGAIEIRSGSVSIGDALRER
jgi:hypothetical protein